MLWHSLLHSHRQLKPSSYFAKYTSIMSWKARFSFQFFYHLWVLHLDYPVPGKLVHTLPFSSHLQLWLYRGRHTHVTFPACSSKLLSYSWSACSSSSRGPTWGNGSRPRAVQTGNFEVLVARFRRRVWFQLGKSSWPRGLLTLCGVA